MPELDAEMAEIIESFFVETNELLESLGQDLLKLETGDDNPDLLNAIFRAVHTIKGTSAFLGFENMSKLSHQCEDLFNKFRKGELQVTSNRMDAIFEAYDLLKELLQQIKSDMNDQFDLTGILSRLETAVRDDTDPENEKQIKQGSEKANSPRQKSSGSDRCASPGMDKQKGSVSPPSPSVTGKAASLDTTIRVDVNRLDNLMNLVGELVLSRNRLLQIVPQFPIQLEDKHIKELNDSSSHLDFITSEIQMAVMKTRMVAIEKLFNKLPRLIRDLSRSLNKGIKLKIYGEETELDKTIIEELNDPLLHLIRNAADHGIENREERVAAGKDPAGQITIKAEHKGNQIIISIMDDGKGLDIETIKRKTLERGLKTGAELEEMPRRDLFNLIFLPGFSTAANITNVSGRGVGMDVVKTNISRLKGIIEIESEPGQGTTFVLKLPLTLAIIQALLVKAGSEVYSIPLDSVIEVIRLHPSQIETMNNKEVVLLRESVLPLIRLHQLFNHQQSTRETTWHYVVVIGLVEKRIGLIVDAMLGQKEIVIKPLGDYLGKIPGIAGSTILGDGRVVMILDVNDIFHLARQEQPVIERDEKPAGILA